ncbi:MAG: RidA family protein [Planctomycetes bacterium]|jgi:2-iminobutanoate/2-iminopropanoate deaminase|nr:RidA family protein [Planctomycetota bacterium]
MGERIGKEIVSTKGAPAAIGPYSQAVVAGGWVWASGQIPIDPASGNVVAGPVAVQTERVLANLKAVLEAAGAGPETVVKCTVYMKDLGKFGEMNEAYGRFFKDKPPARATVQVAGLPKNADVEIDAVAFVKT